MLIDKLDELRHEFNEYEYYDDFEIAHDISKLKEIICILERKAICIDILNFDEDVDYEEKY